MHSSDYMSASARAGCLEDSSNVVRGEPFSTLERDAQLSFALDHSGMAFGSRKTWGIFAEQTGSKRNLGVVTSPLFCFNLSSPLLPPPIYLNATPLLCFDHLFAADSLRSFVNATEVQKVPTTP